MLLRSRTHAGVEGWPLAPGLRYRTSCSRRRLRQVQGSHLGDTDVSRRSPGVGATDTCQFAKPAVVAGSGASPECCDRTCEPTHNHRADFCVVRLCVGGSGFCRVTVQPRFALGIIVIGACAPGSSFSARYLWKSRLEFLSTDLRSWSSGAAERAGGVSGIRKFLSLRRAHPEHSMAQ